MAGAGAAHFFIPSRGCAELLQPLSLQGLPEAISSDEVVQWGFWYLVQDPMEAQANDLVDMGVVLSSNFALKDLLVSTASFGAHQVGQSSTAATKAGRLVILASW